MTAPANPLEPYPALRGLTDAELCERTRRAMVDDETSRIITANCSVCGSEFSYSREGTTHRKKCDNCRGLDERVFGKPPGGTMKYVMCIGTNLNYRRGQYYEWNVVESDIQHGLADLRDFDLTHVRNFYRF